MSSQLDHLSWGFCLAPPIDAAPCITPVTRQSYTKLCRLLSACRRTTGTLLPTIATTLSPTFSVGGEWLKALTSATDEPDTRRALPPRHLDM